MKVSASADHIQRGGKSFRTPSSNTLTSFACSGAWGCTETFFLSL